jgi:DNA-binding SARP family transcriptional activator
MRHDPPVSLAIHLLGAPRVERDGQVLPAPRGRKVWGLLAYLVHRETPVTRSHLAALLFEDAEDPLAALRWTLSELRRLLDGAGPRGDALEFALAPTTYLDTAVVGGGSWVEAVGVPGLGRELLEGMSFAGSPAFQVWLATERRRLQGSAEAILREAAMARLATGAARAAADLAARLVQANPLDENYQALLVRCLAAAGDGAGATRQAAACAALFERELGVSPGAALAAALHTVTAAPVARPATGRAAVAALLEAGAAAVGAGALEAGLQCLRRAVVDADSVGDPTLRAQARVALGGALVHAARGHDEEGATALHEALSVAEGSALPCAAAACRELGFVEFLGGRYERALVWLARAVALAGDDRAELARIAGLRGATLCDTSHYRASLAALGQAEALGDAAGDVRQVTHALAMRGRTLLLCGDLDAAADALDRSVALAQDRWTAFVPWPQSLRGDVDLLRGDVAAAASRFEHAFALGCQIGDPCWEAIAARGLGCVALARGEPQRAAEILVDSMTRGGRLPDAYLWGKGYALDVLCGLAVREDMPQASGWIDELLMLAARSGMRELVARAHLHRARQADDASRDAARMLVQDIDNPVLAALADTCGAAPHGRPS